MDTIIIPMTKTRRRKLNEYSRQNGTNTPRLIADFVDGCIAEIEEQTRLAECGKELGVLEVEDDGKPAA